MTATSEPSWLLAPFGLRLLPPSVGLWAGALLCQGSFYHALSFVLDSKKKIYYLAFINIFHTFIQGVLIICNLILPPAPTSHPFPVTAPSGSIRPTCMYRRVVPSIRAWATSARHPSPRNDSSPKLKPPQLGVERRYLLPHRSRMSFGLILPEQPWLQCGARRVQCVVRSPLGLRSFCSFSEMLFEP